MLAGGLKLLVSRGGNSKFGALQVFRIGISHDIGMTLA
jgi:hypothetical protein